MELVLFDLDHTLLDGDSNNLWVAYLLRHGLAPADTAGRQAQFMHCYAQQTLDIRAYLGFHLGLLTARPLAAWQTEIDAFTRAELLPRVSAAARAAVERHRRAGDAMLIVTATHALLAGGIARALALPLIAPRPVLRDGRPNGEIDGIISFGADKCRCVEDWLAELTGAPLRGLPRRFYSDSMNDLPLLEAVAHPVVVNAEPALAALAAARGWAQERWRGDPVLACQAG